MVAVVVTIVFVMPTVGGDGMAFRHRRVRMFPWHGLAVGVGGRVRTGVVVMMMVVRGIHSSPFSSALGWALKRSLRSIGAVEASLPTIYP